MKIVFATSATDSDFNSDCDCGFVDLAPALANHILGRMDPPSACSARTSGASTAMSWPALVIAVAAIDRSSPLPNEDHSCANHFRIPVFSLYTPIISAQTSGGGAGTPRGWPPSCR
jgi:hypothetical protein